MSNYIKQVNYSILFKLLSIVTVFFTTKILLKSIGVDEYGKWAVIFSLLNTAPLFNFGFSSVIHNVVSKKKYNWNDEFQSLFKANAILAFVSFSIIFSCYYFFSDDFTVSLVFSSIMFILIINSAVIKYYIATDRSHINELYNFSVPIFFFLLILLKMSDSLTVEKLLFLYLISQLICFSFSFIRMLKEVGFKKTDYFTIFENSILIRDGMYFFCIQIVSFMLYSSGRIYTYNFLDAATVTKFDLLAKFMMPILMLSSILFRPLWSVFSKEKSILIINSYISKIDKAILLIFIICLSMGALTPIFISWFFDVNNIQLSTAIIFSMSVFLQVCSQPYCYYLNSRNILRGQLIINLISVIILLGCCFISTSFFKLGLNGIMLSLFISFMPFFIYSRLKVKRDIKNGLLAMD